jgi:hypothetical protein
MGVIGVIGVTCGPPGAVIGPVNAADGGVAGGVSGGAAGGSPPIVGMPVAAV